MEIFFKSDIGIGRVEAINTEIDAGIKNGYLNANGLYTTRCQDLGTRITCTNPSGVTVPYKKFYITDRNYAQGNTNYIALPSSFSGPKGNGRYEKNQLLSPLAVVSHEFGHTKYATPVPVNAPISYEVGVMDSLENPVRLQYGYQPRRTYTDSLGATTTPGATAPSRLYP